MNAPQPKKLLIVNILDILRKYSDADHRLSQKEIGQLLLSEHGMRAGRNAIRRNLADLIDFGYEIEYTESVRTRTDPKTGRREECALLTDFYLVRDFTDAELRLLIDGLLFSRHVPQKQCRALIGKLEGLSSIYFRSRVRHIARMPDAQADNRQVFLNIELLDEAISKKRKVSFQYLSYGTDKLQHPRKRSDGSEEYVVSPYQMAAKEGKYYLICNMDKFDSAANYRIDRISNLQILDLPARPYEALQGMHNLPFDLKEYMEKHVYMFPGTDCVATLRVSRSILSDVIDLFGKNITFSDEDAQSVTVRVNANERSVVHFAQKFAPDAVLLSPAALRQEVCERLQCAVRRYLTEGVQQICTSFHF